MLLNFLFKKQTTEAVGQKLLMLPSHVQNVKANV